MDLYKFETLVGSIHFVDWGLDPWWSPSTLWTCINLRPWWGPPTLWIGVLTLGGGKGTKLRVRGGLTDKSLDEKGPVSMRKTVRKRADLALRAVLSVGRFRLLRSTSGLSYSGGVAFFFSPDHHRQP